MRDVVRAYRLLLERLAEGKLGRGPLVVNVATGRAEPIRSMMDQLCTLAGVSPELRIDPALVRLDDPPEVRGDATLLRELTGWRPEIPLARTLADLLAEAEAEAAAGA